MLLLEADILSSLASCNDYTAAGGRTTTLASIACAIQVTLPSLFADDTLCTIPLGACVSGSARGRHCLFELASRF